MFGHETANSGIPKDRASSVKVTVARSLVFHRHRLLRENTHSVRSKPGLRPMLFRNPEVERLTANKLFIVSRFCYRNSNRSGVSVRITSTCHCCSLCFQNCGNAISNQLLDGIQTSRGYSMIHNDGDGDNDAYDDDRGDDEREISWYYETTRWNSKDLPDLFGDELGFPQ
ncbi:hypothetical protein Tco_1000056 [Tanacetum coccineum]